MLQEFGHPVIEACDGNEAVTKFLAHKDEIQLVLMDVIMPRKSGGDAYKEIKAIRPDVKIILTSGYTGDYLAGKIDMAADVHFVSKPISPKALFEKIGSVLRRRTE
jgi:CheY-like chemotaxis protein